MHQTHGIDCGPGYTTKEYAHSIWVAGTADFPPLAVTKGTVKNRYYCAGNVASSTDIATAEVHGGDDHGGGGPPLTHRIDCGGGYQLKDDAEHLAAGMGDFASKRHNCCHGPSALGTRITILVDK